MIPLVLALTGCRVPPRNSALSCCFRAVGSQLPLTFLPRALWEQLEEDKRMGECASALGPSPFRKWGLGAQVVWAQEGRHSRKSCGVKGGPGDPSVFQGWEFSVDLGRGQARLLFLPGLEGESHLPGLEGEFQGSLGGAIGSSVGTSYLDRTGEEQGSQTFLAQIPGGPRVRPEACTSPTFPGVAESWSQDHTGACRLQGAVRLEGAGVPHLSKKFGLLDGEETRD